MFIILYRIYRPTGTARECTCVRNVGVHNARQVIGAEQDGLLELFSAKHVQWDVEALEQHPCRTDATGFRVGTEYRE